MTASMQRLITRVLKMLIGSSIQKGAIKMLVDVEIRERLSYFCIITKQTQERAANQALREMLDRCENDPLMSERMNRAKALREAIDNL